MTNPRNFTSTHIASLNEKARTISFVASSESPDRYDDIIRVAGWQLANFQKNPVFLWAHNASAPPIGKVVGISKGDGALRCSVQFADAAANPFADQIFRLYCGGFLNAVSVGFQPLEFKPRDGGSGYEITKQELLEVSGVPIPANPEALSLAAGGERGAEMARQWMQLAFENSRQSAANPFLGKLVRVCDEQRRTRGIAAVGSFLEHVHKSVRK